MPFAQMNAYIVNGLPADVAAYLDPKSANFPNVADYYAPNNGYFNEDTIKGVMFQCLNAWIAGHENANHYLVRTEVQYPGFENIADIWIVYDAGVQDVAAQNIAIELKANFAAESVNQDIELLDAMAGVQDPVFDNAYACYVVQQGHGGWTNYIDEPVAPDVASVGITVVF